jgi:hypothetical protein
MAFVLNKVIAERICEQALSLGLQPLADVYGRFDP